MGQWFDLEGTPNEAWLRGQLFPVEIHGREPETFPVLAGMLARAMRVDAERISVQQTHPYAGRFLLDGEPIGRISPAAMHTYFTALVSWIGTRTQVKQ